MKIVLVSDTHLTPRTLAFGENLATVFDWIAARKPDLVVNLGDITADGAGDAEELAPAHAAFAALGCPVRFVPGNHDIGDNPMAPGAKNKHPLDLDRLAEYRRVFGPDYWSFDHEGWQIVGLNAQLLGTDTAQEEQQFAWLEETLRGWNSRLGVMIHKPLFRNGPADTEAHIRYVPLAPRRRLMELLHTRDLRFVVSGHAHQTRRFTVDGVEHAWAPSTAFCLPDAMQERIGEKIVGVLTLELGAQDHRFDAVTPDGLIRHNILDHPQVYHEIAVTKARLGGAGAVL